MAITRVPLFFLFAILLLSGLFACPAARAQDCGDSCVLYPDDGFGGWEDLGGYGPPTMNKCTANGSANQACRQCDQTLNPNGTFTFFCGWTPRAAACACNYPTMPYCAGQGTCTYVG